MGDDLENIFQSIKGLSLENKRKILHFLQQDKDVMIKDSDGIENILDDFVANVRSRFELKLKST